MESSGLRRPRLANVPTKTMVMCAAQLFDDYYHFLNFKTLLSIYEF